MTRYFKDFYGTSAKITTHKDGTAVLKMSAGGKRFWNKTYATERGAKIAMGKMSDCWREVK